MVRPRAENNFVGFCNFKTTSMTTTYFFQNNDKQNITFAVILYDMFQIRQWLVSLISYETATCIRSSI